MLKLVAAAPALATALGFLLLAGTPAWAHKNLTSTSISLSSNSVTQGTIVDITATVTFTGFQGGGNANGQGSDACRHRNEFIESRASLR